MLHSTWELKHLSLNKLRPLQLLYWANIPFVSLLTSLLVELALVASQQEPHTFVIRAYIKNKNVRCLIFHVHQLTPTNH